MKTAQIEGNTSLEQVITREEAGKLLAPPVSDRQVRTYLKYAYSFLPAFEHFRDKDNGGLNRYARLNPWHIPVLQRIRTYARDYGLTKLRMEMRRNPQFFESGTDMK